MFDAELGGDFGGFTGELDAGASGRVAGDIDVGPRDAAAPAGAEDFQDGFFGGEAAGEVLEIALGILGTILLFGRGEDAVEEVLAVLGVEVADAVDFDEVDAVADDRHGWSLSMPNAECQMPNEACEGVKGAKGVKGVKGVKGAKVISFLLIVKGGSGAVPDSSGR